jgi:glycosyltransferase involved in cell wall biosynthesis
MRIVVAHEWVTQWAGSERVARQLLEVSGSSELVTAIADDSVAREYFPGAEVRPLWPDRLPGASAHWSRYGPALLAAWAGHRVEADAVLVSSHFAAHAVTRRFDGPSIVYYHTPARMLWCPEMELDRLPAHSRAIVRTGVLPALRSWDRHVARSPTHVLANSTAVAERIARVYGREARVVHPPVDVERWATVPSGERGYVLWLGRLVAYKRLDLAVEAARRAGLPLVVVGDGPDRHRFPYEPPEWVRFLGSVSEDEVRAAMASARVLVMPGEEDFGIAPVEAMAAGVPVVAYGAGGARDYVEPGVNGLLVDQQDAGALALALREAWHHDWDEAAVRASAQRFGVERFRKEIADVLDGALGRNWRAVGATA